MIDGTSLDLIFGSKNGMKETFFKYAHLFQTVVVYR
jgi:hypothetical protein